MLRHRERRALFPTLLTSFEVDLTAAAGLRDEILARARTRPTVARGERTGWQSDDGLLRWSGHARWLGELLVDALAAAFPEAAIDDAMLVAWANVLGTGDHFTPHTHADAAWSGVLYLDAGDAGSETGGLLQLRDPRAGAGMVVTPLNRFDSACTFEIAPRTGLLAIFPAWLPHWVTPYRGTRPRISVAFNAR